MRLKVWLERRLTSNLEEDVSRGCCIRSFCNANPNELAYESLLVNDVEIIEWSKEAICKNVNESSSIDGKDHVALQKEMEYLNRMKDVSTRIQSVRQQTESIINECEELLRSSSSLHLEFYKYLAELKTLLDVGKQSIVEEEKCTYLLSVATSLRERIKMQAQSRTVAVLDCYW